MAKSCFPKCRLGRIMGWLQILFGGLVIIISISTLSRFYSAGFFLQSEDFCCHFYGSNVVYQGVDIAVLAARLNEVVEKMEMLQEKLESTVQRMGTSEDEVIRPLYSARIVLCQIRQM